MLRPMMPDAEKAARFQVLADFLVNGASLEAVLPDGSRQAIPDVEALLIATDVMMQLQARYLAAHGSPTEVIL